MCFNAVRLTKYVTFDLLRPPQSTDCGGLVVVQEFCLPRELNHKKRWGHTKGVLAYIGQVAGGYYLISIYLYHMGQGPI